jgi:SAM-dependent methyltransferase
MICPICHNSYYFLLESGGDKLVCRKCGHEGKYTDPSYSDYHEKRYSYSKVRNIKNDPLLKKIVESNIINKKSMVLDYGCGAGDYTNYVAKLSKMVIGTDIDVKKAQNRFPKLEWVRIDPKRKNLKFKSDNFDVILAVNLIEHVHDFDFLLNEFERILKKGGYLFITTYDTNFVLHKILNDPTHVYEWDELSFEKFISKNFKVIKSFKHGSFFNYYPFNKAIVKFLKPELCVIAKKNLK